jgi:uncharacterized membrane protein YfcA
MGIPFTTLMLALLAFLLAGMIKGVVGFGLPTVAIGLLGLVMTPAEAASLLVVPTLVTNVWQLAAGSRLKPLLQRLWTMLLATCVATYATAGLLANDTTGRASTALGVALILYAIIGLAALRLSVPPRMEVWLSPLMGALTGLVAGATGIFSMPGIPYLQALGLDKEDLVQALGLSFTVSMAALAGGLAREGAFHTSVAVASFLALAPALVGMFVGQWIRLRVRPEVFRLWFFLGLLALGAYLALHALI